MLHDASSFTYSWEDLGVMISGTAAFCSYLLTFVTSEGADVGAGKRRSAMWVVMVSHIPLCECSITPVVFFVKICYINFRIGIMVHNIDHNPHYCQL